MAGMTTAMEPRYARRAERMVASEIRELLKLLDQPDMTSFAGGIPDPALLPHDAARDAYADVLRDPALARTALQYSVSEGYEPLRRWIAGYMTARGVACVPDNILITSGSQQALDFLARLLITPGDTVLVTWPTYLGALQAFNAYEPRYDRLDLGATNMTPSALDVAARDACPGARAKFAYVVPDFANPSGETLTLGQREHLLDLAEALEIPVIEDAAYSELRYDGDPVPSVMALDHARCGGIERTRTIHCGTFSKTLSPGLRVGWICAARPLIDRLVLIKQASDLNSPLINQMVMHRLAESVFEDQVARARSVYRRRRDRMLAALARTMPDGVRWTEPEGGLFIWVRFPEGMDAAALLEWAVSDARVAFVPGKAFHADGSGTRYARFSFSLAGEEAIDTGIGRLAALLRQAGIS